MFFITEMQSLIDRFPGGNCPRAYPIEEKTTGSFIVHHILTLSERAVHLLAVIYEFGYVLSLGEPPFSSHQSGWEK